MGTTEVVPWSYTCRRGGYRTAPSDGLSVGRLETTSNAVPLRTLAEPFPARVVVGHETDGLPADVLAACDLVASITTYGVKQSLNVALAYGVAILRLAEIWAAGETR